MGDVLKLFYYFREVCNMKLELTKLFSRNLKIEEDIINITDIYNKKNNCNINYFFEENKININKPFLYIASNKGKIVGCISLFVFDEYEMEIFCVANPAYNEEYILKYLFNELKADYHNYYIQSYSDKKDNYHASILKSLGFNYSKTECIMAINNFEYTPSNNSIELNIYENGNTIYYYAMHEGAPIGRCMADIDNDIASISNVRVVELFRNQGNATKMLSMVLDDLFKKYNYAILHVTMENTPAFKLYTKLGFNIKQAAASFETKI